MTGGKSFCCVGCLAVFELLTDNGLDEFYKLGEAAGVRVTQQSTRDLYNYIDEPGVRERLVDYSDDRLTRVTFRIPAVHCIACVWLLENLFHLNPAIGNSQVNFPRKEISISFDPRRLSLSELVSLLASLGYEPELKLSDLEAPMRPRRAHGLSLQVGIAGFAFGNIMLFSIASYFGLDSFSGPIFHRLFGWLSLVLATPVVFYSARDYWRGLLISLRQKLLTIDVPIAIGIAAIYLQSIWETASGRGEGYFDSLCGLIFFLLCGKCFQQKTFARLAFDRDYKSFFPLSITRVLHRAEARISLSQLAIGDELLIHNEEIIPADARLLQGPALLDYSFVTGESEPVAKLPGDYLYAGGRQLGGVIRVRTTKHVSQSYLTSLWNQPVFRKSLGDSLENLTNRYSRRFTRIILTVALAAAAYWAFANPSLSLKAFISVLIVACPCALALAAPFTLGTALRMLGRRDIYLKNPTVLEDLARVDAIVFDKTGTLTTQGKTNLRFEGTPLSAEEQGWIHSLAKHSLHPHSLRIAAALEQNRTDIICAPFIEKPGYGIRGMVAGHELWIGSAAWLSANGIAAIPLICDSGSVVHVAVDLHYRGSFVLGSELRSNISALFEDLSGRYQLALLSGDNERERPTFSAVFGPKAQLFFHQTPLDKLNFIKRLQKPPGKIVLMVGDGLNDAGALQQSNVGIAVVENISAFSPASDVIMSAAQVPQLGQLLRFSKRVVRIVHLSFLISSLYNVVGLAIAACGLLSPIVCAILMPLSSVTVVAFACGMTAWSARRFGFVPRETGGRL